MKTNMLQKGLSGLTALALALGLTACGSGRTTAAEEAAGTLLLSVNPEIQIAYDQQDQVLSLTGVNDDGKAVVGSLEAAEYQ